MFAYIGQNKGSFTAHYVGFGPASLVLYGGVFFLRSLRNFELTTREVGLLSGDTIVSL